MGIDLKTIELLKMKVEILKIKSDDYTWQCYTPKNVKDQLEETLLSINEALEIKLPEQNGAIITKE